LAQGKADLQSYGDRLSSENYRTRWDALEEIGSSPAAARPLVPLLIDHLKNKDDRPVTVQTLGKLGQIAEPALPALCSMLQETLKDPSPYDDNASLRPALMASIGNIKQTPQTTDILRLALKHPVSTVRYEAAHVLGLGGSIATPAIPDLEKLSTDHEYVGLYEYPYGKDVAASAALALQNLRTK
jgi:HEAT repeat protein